jgi:UDP-N-acetyl-D-mannosaminuronic acid dehydrogenase
MSLKNLLEKVKSNNFTICVLGLGRVGLPLATVFANSGIKVLGVDVNQERLDSIKNSKCPFYDPELQSNLEQALSSKNLVLSSSLDSISNATSVIFVTVGTPTLENSIDYSQVYSALNKIVLLNLKEKMLIFRSTLPPQTTTDIIIPFLENKSSLTAGIDFGIAMCPERILEGKAIQELYELPEIIGGINSISNDIATNTFLILNKNKEFLYTTPTGAELAKLFANIYRYTSFALSNEFAIWAEKFGLNARDLIQKVNHDYSRSNIPVPGFAGGPCLSKDGLFLDSNSAFSSIISSVWKLNESIPQHIVNSIKNITGNLFNKKIAVLGISFKSGSDDTRNSPSLKLVDILKSIGSEVKIHDPYVTGTLSLKEVLQDSEIIIIATNHKEFDNIASDINSSNCDIIYDVWGIFNDESFPNKKYYEFGSGHSTSINKLS